MRFLRQVTGKKAQNLGVNTWQKEGADRVLQAEGENPLRGYIKERQATVSEWVDLQIIFGVYVKETGYAGGGRLREQWWYQTSAEWQLKTTLK